MDTKTIQELRDFRNDLSGHPCLQMILDGILSRAEQAAKEEPLEELAKRKGLEIFVQIEIQGGGIHNDIDGDNFEDADIKARAYLAGLPDKEAA